MTDQPKYGERADQPTMAENVNSLARRTEERLQALEKREDPITAGGIGIVVLWTAIVAGPAALWIHAMWNLVH
jgi:hypothetical protein